MVDMSEASKILDNTVIVCGNLNPVAEIQNLSADALFEKSRGLVERMRGRRFILSGGCEITVGTPHENLKRMKEAADFGKVGI
jgi:uroporphyrinogen-III decarboxylase